MVPPFLSHPWGFCRQDSSELVDELLLAFAAVISPQEFVTHLRKEYEFKNLKHIENVRKETSLMRKPGSEGNRNSTGFRQGAPGTVDARDNSNFRRAKPGELEARDHSNFKREKSAK